MAASSRFRVNTPKVVHQTIDGEVVIIDFDQGNYYSLRGSGASAWELIGQGASIDEITTELERRFTTSEGNIDAAVQDFISTLREEHLIVPLNGAAPAFTPTTEAPPEESPPFTAPALHKYTDMQELLLLDPIHDVDDAGWPHMPQDDTDADA